MMVLCFSSIMSLILRNFSRNFCTLLGTTTEGSISPRILPLRDPLPLVESLFTLTSEYFLSYECFLSLSVTLSSSCNLLSALLSRSSKKSFFSRTLLLIFASYPPCSDVTKLGLQSFSTNLLVSAILLSFFASLLSSFDSLLAALLSNSSLKVVLLSNSSSTAALFSSSSLNEKKRFSVGFS